MLLIQKLLHININNTQIKITTCHARPTPKIIGMKLVSLLDS